VTATARTELIIFALHILVLSNAKQLKHRSDDCETLAKCDLPLMRKVDVLTGCILLASCLAYISTLKMEAMLLRNVG
jgi:hypothetical protein